MMRAGDQRVDVCLHLKSWQILSSSAIHAFTQTLVFPPQRRIYAARQLHASYQLHVLKASGDHPACDRRCRNKAELNQSWRLNLSLGLFFDAFMTVLPAPAEPNWSVSVDVCPPDLRTARCSDAFRLDLHPGLVPKCWDALSTQVCHLPNV